MSIHIEAKIGEIAPVVLLPGDPLRAQFIAKTFLKDPVRYNQVRNALGYTGHYQGKRVSVQSTGMGMPSHAIYVHELIHDYGAKVLVRVGTCGAIQTDLHVRDLVLCMAACTDSSMNRLRFGGMDFAPAADFELLRLAHEVAVERGSPVRVGSVLTSDTFHSNNPSWWKVWSEHGVLAAEMETAVLYTLASHAKARALSILTVSDHILLEEHTTAGERETSFGEMIEVALCVVSSLASEQTPT